MSWLKRTALDVDRLAIVTSEEEFQWWEADDAEPKFRRTREKLVEGNAGDNKVCIENLVRLPCRTVSISIILIIKFYIWVKY